MLIEQVVADLYGTNCWILFPRAGSSARPGECVVIDPGIANPHLLAKLDVVFEHHHLRPVAVIATHGHLDHTFSIQPLTARTGIPAYIHSSDRELLRFPERALSPETRSLFVDMNFVEPEEVLELRDGAVLELAGLTLYIDHAPGHTAGSVLIRMENTGTGEAHLFSGDVLFNNGIGRTDLPTGSPEKMRDSLLKVLTLDDAYHVYPGHGGTTTIGEERYGNPYLAAALQGDF